MNFLDICKDVDTMSGLNGDISSVLSEITQHKIIVQAVKDGFIDLQLDRMYWKFMRKTVEFSTTAGKSKYTVSEIFGTPTNDFGRWDTRVKFNRFYITDPLTGKISRMLHLPFDFFRDRYSINPPSSEGQPDFLTTDEVDSSMSLSTPPDKLYVISADYYVEPQVLTGNADIPILPSRFHKLLVYKGLEYVAGHYSNGSLFSTYATSAARLHGQLYRDQNPAVRVTQQPIA